MDLLREFLKSFLPLFVAIDAIGIVGIYVALTQDFSASGRKRLLLEASITALGISILFLLFGKFIFEMLGITENDFRIAGGLILLILAIMDLLFNQLENRRNPSDGGVGVVPIGIPLIMGPAALTTIMISAESQGLVMTSVALAVNLVIVFVVFANASRITQLIGKAGTKAIAKIMSLFLAAIGIMMIRIGILAALGL